MGQTKQQFILLQEHDLHIDETYQDRQLVVLEDKQPGATWNFCDGCGANITLQEGHQEHCTEEIWPE